MSSCGADAGPKRRECLVFSLRNTETVDVHADVAVALELIIENHALVHVLAEGRAGDVANEKNEPVGSLVRPFEEEVG